MAESYLNTKEIAPEELYAKEPNEMRTKEPYFSEKREYDVNIQNYIHQQELVKRFKSFKLRRAILLCQ